MNEEIQKGTIIYSSDGKEKGTVATGKRIKCNLEGCRDMRYAVRWPDGHITYPCNEGLKTRKDGELQII
jgi:hypothetical protein